MIRALWFAIRVGLLIALAVWIANQSGSVRVEWQEYTITVHVGLFLVAALAFVLLTLFIYQTLKTFIDFPKSLARYNEIKARENGYKALTRGLTAVAAGDKKAAAQYAKRARKLLSKDTGLPLLLQAQAARLEGREDDAQACFVALLENEDASFLGVRGLLQSALDRGDDAAALSLSERALSLHPKQNWILKITYDLQIRLRDWRAAERTLVKAQKYGAMTAEKARSDHLALYLAQAEKEQQDGFSADAHMLIHKALKLQPGCAPAVILLAEFYAQNGQGKKAQHIVLKAWKAAPHGALVSCWLRLQPEKERGDKLAQLRWIEKLLKQNPDSPAGQLKAGQIATEAGLWGDARNHFKRAEVLGPSASLYQSWALLEERSTHDETAIKSWLAKAAMAPPDKGWMCKETGHVYERWHPVAMPHGRFNTIVWDVPFSHGAVVVLDEKTRMAEALIEAPDSNAA